MPRPTPAVTLNPLALTVLREKDGHTLVSLAKAAKISVGYLNDLEKGRRVGNPGVIRALADALNVPASLLETRREDPAA